MPRTHYNNLVFKVTPAQVCRLLQIDEATAEKWQSEDLAAMVRHQLLAPLEFDLKTAKPDADEQKTLARVSTGTSRSGPRTFGELFQASRPPADLLRLSQKFFKQKVSDNAGGSAERKVAYLFYLLSIVIARTRTGVRISKLSDEELRRARRSIMNRPWLGDAIRRLLSGASF